MTKRHGALEAPRLHSMLMDDYGRGGWGGCLGFFGFLGLRGLCGRGTASNLGAWAESIRSPVHPLLEKRVDDDAGAAPLRPVSNSAAVEHSRILRTFISGYLIAVKGSAKTFVGKCHADTLTG